MLEAQPVTHVQEETKDEIPFGIRAIQSGIEVDGVWISRTNTPVGSSRASIMSEQLPRSFNNSQLELPLAVDTTTKVPAAATATTTSPATLLPSTPWNLPLLLATLLLLLVSVDLRT